MPILNKNFHLEITPEQFINACSADELQELQCLLDGFSIQLKKLDASPVDVGHWINLYEERNFPVEELEAISIRIHKNQTIDRSEKIARLMAIIKILTTTTGDAAVVAARNVLDIVYKYNR